MTSAQLAKATVLMAVLLATVPAIHGFYLFFPQANDRIMALEVADSAVAGRVPDFGPDGVLVDQVSEAEAPAAKRTSAVSRGSLMRRRSAEGYHCPCLHKVCTYHCMTK